MGRVLQLARDDHGRIAALRIEGPDEHSGIVTVASYEYSDEGDLVAVHDALGHVTAYAYQHHLMVEERNRNEAIEGIQGNRNPFVDYPHLDDRINNF